MITEDYVSFEVAKLLKEKGFDAVICQNSPYYAYNIDGQFSGPSWDTVYVAPTLQMAMKWLETTYYIFICIDRHFYVKDKISHIACGFTYSYDIKHINSIHKETGFSTYKQACEAAIKYCLENLI